MDDDDAPGLETRRRLESVVEYPRGELSLLGWVPDGTAWNLSAFAAPHLLRQPARGPVGTT